MVYITALNTNQRTVIQMDEYYIQDKTEELNKRIDDAFTELDIQRNRMSGLTRENSELKQEIERLESRINKANNFIVLERSFKCE